MKPRLLTYRVPTYFPNGRDRVSPPSPERLLRFPKGTRVEAGPRQFPVAVLKRAGEKEFTLLDETGRPLELTDSQIDALLRAVEEGLPEDS